jgi:hypothetical protein
MLASKCVLALAVVCLSNLCLSSFAAADQSGQSDQSVAERILGPQWRQLSRRAGMIFTGTVLTSASQSAATARAGPGANPSLELRFRVDRAIAGVDAGQTLTIHEWAGAWSMHRPMLRGQHILIFLYPPSRLGFTSPVGGSRGQVVLDASGKIVAEKRSTSVDVRSDSSTRPRVAGVTERVSVIQLERAIRGARNEEE